MRVLPWLLLLPICAWAEGAHNAALNDAKAKLDALQFEPAARRAGEGISAGEASPQELAELYFVLAQASAVLGRTDEAVDAFGRALELSPALTLPPGTSPRVAEPFRRALAAAGGERLTASPTATAGADGQVQVRVQLRGDTFRLVDRGEVEFRAGESWSAVPLAPTEPPQAYFPCAEARCAFRLTLFDPRHNRVLEVGTRAAPLFVGAPVIVPSPAAPETKPELVATTPDSSVDATGKPFYARPTPWIVAGAVAAAAGGFFAWQYAASDQRLAAIEQHRAAHSFSEANDEAQVRARNHALMWTGFGVAGAAGAVAVFVF